MATTTTNEILQNPSGTELEMLLKLKAIDLLEKFGAGNHKPGSGSAAAYNGILSCKLILTVIQLTTDPKRAGTYFHCMDECKRMEEEIVNRICPRLETLFQEDSMQFDLTIRKRNERNAEPNWKKRNSLDEKALEELEKSTELPLEIANYCLELSRFSLYLIENGFKSARGDSGMALSSALSSVSGCLSIISLNLQSFPTNNWTRGINEKKSTIRTEYDRLIEEQSKSIDVLDHEAELKGAFFADLAKIKSELLGKSAIKNLEIETLARNLQNILWKHRNIIWPENTPVSHLEILRPKKVIKSLKYFFKEIDTLGVNDANEEIAGIIDNEKGIISISTRFQPEVINFTTAHELGHALLHDKLLQHRDIPRDGSQLIQSRSTEELQADKFATYFLMPEKIVRRVFEEIFHTEKLTLNQETAFSIASVDVNKLRKLVRDQRGFSRLIAGLTFYNHTAIHSLSALFNVSTEAMAIRLEELQLVRF